MNNDYERYNFWNLELPKVKQEPKPEVKDSDKPKLVDTKPVEIKS